VSADTAGAVSLWENQGAERDGKPVPYNNILANKHQPKNIHKTPKIFHKTRQNTTKIIPKTPKNKEQFQKAMFLFSWSNDHNSQFTNHNSAPFPEKTSKISSYIQNNPIFSSKQGKTVNLP